LTAGDGLGFAPGELDLVFAGVVGTVVGSSGDSVLTLVFGEG
jgi:hypothetical protein